MKVLTQDEIKQVTHDDGRYYEVEINGEVHQLISVTTVLNILSKPALVPWAYNVGVENTIKILKDSYGFREDLASLDTPLMVKQVKQALKEAEMTYDNRRNEGADRGTTVHAYLEARVAGVDPPAESEQYPDYCKQLDKFLSDYSPTFHESELTVVSLAHKYAGTLDAICTINKHPSRRRHPSMVGKKVVLDLKTNNSGSVYPEMHYPQIDAYAIAYAEMHDQPFPEDYDEYGMVVAVGPESYAPGVSYFTKGCFLPILAAYNMLDKCKALNPNGRK